MVLIVGHRGSPAQKPENTIASFDKAVADGAGAIEFDVRKCRDAIVVIHDSTVDRTTNGLGRIKRMSLEQLQNLNAGDGQKIPTFEAVLDYMRGKGCKLFIEVKARQIAAELAEIITQKVALQEWEYSDLVVICFYPDILEKIKLADSEIQIGVHFTKDPNDGCFGEGDLKRAIERLSPDYVLPACEIVTREFVQQSHDLGTKVVAWTVNEGDSIKKVIAAGVDAIIGDDSGLIKKIVG